MSRFELSAPMTVLRLRAYLDGLGSGSGGQVARGVIYKDVQGEPGALLATSAQRTITDGAPPVWVDFTFTAPVSLGPGNYWLGLHFGGSDNTIRFRNTHGSGSSRVQTFDAYADGASDPFGITFPYADRHSIYAVGIHDPVVAGAGDIATGGPGDEATARLLDSLNPDAVITIGDNVNTSGSATDFMNYYDPTWGRHKNKTHPAPGNHEYQISGASGYFGYFGAAAGEQGKGYYSYDMGAWHVVVLNTNSGNSGCTTISCSAGSAQEQWLRSDLAAHPAACTLAYFHHPLFSANSTGGGGTPAVRPLWQALYDHGADVILQGHAHNYQRYAPMTPSGALDSGRGIRSFVVGTGGASHTPVGSRTGLQAKNGDTFGVLRLTMHPSSYDWKFVPEAGKTFTDAGSGSCH